METKKIIYVPDTTVFLYAPEIFHALGVLHKPGMCHIYVHTAVIREIDGIKNGSNRRAGAAREIARELDRWGSYGDLIEGVPLPSGGMVHVFSDYDPIDELASVADNRIVGGAMVLNRINHGNVTVLTTDHNMRTIARAHYLKGEFYPFGCDWREGKKRTHGDTHPARVDNDVENRPKIPLEGVDEKEKNLYNDADRYEDISFSHAIKVLFLIFAALGIVYNVIRQMEGK